MVFTTRNRLKNKTAEELQKEISAIFVKMALLEFPFIALFAICISHAMEVDVLPLSSSVGAYIVHTFAPYFENVMDKDTASIVASFLCLLPTMLIGPYCILKAVPLSKRLRELSSTEG